MNFRLICCALLALTSGVNCKSPAASVTSSQTSPLSNRPTAESVDEAQRDPIVLQAFPEYDVPVVPPGITEEELLRRADAAIGPQAEAALQLTGWQIPPDLGFVDAQPVQTLRSHFNLTLGDEREDRPLIERSLRLDDQGDRLVALYYGTGLPIAPGFRIAGRTSMSGWALISADQQSHRLLPSNALRSWFFATQMSSGSAVSFRQSAEALVATRGVLSVSIVPDPSGPDRPLTCRFFVGLLLGGDSAEARAGCSSVKAPIRVTLRARGLPVLVVSRRTADLVQLPRDAMAVVPPSAQATELQLPRRAPEGSFFAPNELHGLEPPRAPGSDTVRRADAGHSESQLLLRNTTASELLVFVDSVAVGWLAAGRTSTFQGMQNGPHRVRARSLDGTIRTDEALVNAPGSWTAVSTR